MVNKKLTIAQVEAFRGEMNTAIAIAVQKFEEETGIRVGYIDTVRERDKENDTRPTTLGNYDDQGPVVAVNANIHLDC